MHLNTNNLKKDNAWMVNKKQKSWARFARQQINNVYLLHLDTIKYVTFGNLNQEMSSCDGAG